MSDPSDDRTASLMTPAKLAQLKMRPQPAASPAAWLDQLAADAGSGHARRLVDLRRQLETQVQERDYQALRSALRAWYEDLEKLDFDLLQPKGWLARTLGRAKEEAAGFGAGHRRIVRGGEELAQEVKALQRRQQAQDGATERTLVEVDVEVRALEKIMEQGTRWLQDMRGQLKARAAVQGSDAALQQQVREDTARCELLVGRLKQLRAAVAAAQRAVERCKKAAGRRDALLESLQQALDGEWKGWLARLEPVAAEAVASGSAGAGLRQARISHQELQQCVKQADKDCSQLQKREEALAAELAALQEPLQAAA